MSTNSIFVSLNRRCKPWPSAIELRLACVTGPLRPFSWCILHAAINCSETSIADTVSFFKRLLTEIMGFLVTSCMPFGKISKIVTEQSKTPASKRTYGFPVHLRTECEDLSRDQFDRRRAVLHVSEARPHTVHMAGRSCKKRRLQMVSHMQEMEELWHRGVLELSMYCWNSRGTINAVLHTHESLVVLCPPGIRDKMQSFNSDPRLPQGSPRLPAASIYPSAVGSIFASVHIIHTSSDIHWHLVN